MNFISIDPGKTGAIVAWVDGVPDAWHQFAVKGRWFDSDDVETIAGFYDHASQDKVVIEALMDRRIHRQSSIANNTTASNWGMHLAIALWYRVPTDIVSASAWKKRLELSSDKELSMTMARDLYPMCADSLKLKKNHDLAEALLIGYDFLQRNKT